MGDPEVNPTDKQRETLMGILGQMMAPGAPKAPTGGIPITIDLRSVTIAIAACCMLVGKPINDPTLTTRVACTAKQLGTDLFGPMPLNPED